MEVDRTRLVTFFLPALIFVGRHKLSIPIERR
jgi:hypothetical protein